MSNKGGVVSSAQGWSSMEGGFFGIILLQRSDANSVVVVIPRLKGFPISFRHFRFVDSIQNLPAKVLTY